MTLRVDLQDPGPEDLRDVARELGLPEAWPAEIGSGGHRPRLEHDARWTLLVLRTLRYVEDGDAVETAQLSVAVGDDSVLVVRVGDVPGGGAAPVRAAVEGPPERVVGELVDEVLGTYDEVLAALEADVDEVEESVFSGRRTRDAPRIYGLKRELAEVRRAVLPLRELLHRLMEGTHEPAVPARLLARITRLAESVEELDALLAAVFDAHVATIQVQQNDDMRTISAGVGLVAAPTLVAGVYGMNFVDMPELHWTLGYPFALVLMVASSALAWWFFKRSGWL